jgi:hypothetical protein
MAQANVVGAQAAPRRNFMLKLIVAYALFLVMRQTLHQDAAYFSVNLMVPLMKMAVPLFETILGYKPTIIFIFEVVCSVLCVLIGPKIARALTAILPARRPNNAPAAVDAAARGALTRSLIVLFVLVPAVYYGSTVARNYLYGDPHNYTPPLLISAGKVSVEDTASYVSPRVASGSTGQLVLCVDGACVEDVAEEEYQRSKSGDTASATPPPKPKASDKKPHRQTTDVTAIDLHRDQDPRVYSIMKDLGKIQFLGFCAFCVLFSTLGSVILDKMY